MTNSLPTTTEVGQLTENIAIKHLQAQGLVLIAKNVHSRLGEIDIVMKQADTWVFVEVKYRKHSHFGGAISAISKSKQKKIKLCAAFYFQQHNLNEYNTPCRFDVVALDGPINQLEITWLENAF
ncbi:MAG: YraN family protein [Colwellia sp.]